MVYQKELGESLRGFAAYCKRIGGFNADMAGSYLEEAADYIYACLSEVKYVKTKRDMGEEKSYKSSFSIAQQNRIS